MPDVRREKKILPLQQRPNDKKFKHENFMLKFCIIWSLLKGVKFVIGPSLALLAKDTFLLSSDIWHHCWLLPIRSFSNQSIFHQISFQLDHYAIRSYSIRSLSIIAFSLEHFPLDLRVGPPQGTPPQDSQEIRSFVIITGQFTFISYSKGCIRTHPLPGGRGIRATYAFQELVAEVLQVLKK